MLIKKKEKEEERERERDKLKRQIRKTIDVIKYIN